jgi:ribose 5-phosphate isomerase B
LNEALVNHSHSATPVFRGTNIFPALQAQKDARRARVVPRLPRGETRGAEPALARLPYSCRQKRPSATEEHEMRVGFATDHAGFALRNELIAHLREAGHEVVDVGAYSLNPDDDYPDFVIPLARAVASGKVERGIAVCGSGVGAAVCANKIPGVRAGLVQDHYSARQGVEHDDMNILCMGGRVVGPAVALDLVDAFLAARFSGAERHLRRLRKVAALETGSAAR